MKHNVKTKIASILMAGAMMATAAVPTMACSKLPIRPNLDGTVNYGIHTLDGAMTGSHTSLPIAVKDIAEQGKEDFQELQSKVKDAFGGVTANAASLSFNFRGDNRNSVFDGDLKTTLQAAQRDHSQTVNQATKQLKNKLDGYQVQAQTNAEYLTRQAQAAKYNLNSALKAPFTGVQSRDDESFATGKEYKPLLKTIADDAANLSYGYNPSAYKQIGVTTPKKKSAKKPTINTYMPRQK